MKFAQRIENDNSIAASPLDRVCNVLARLMNERGYFKSSEGALHFRDFFLAILANKSIIASAVANKAFQKEYDATESLSQGSPTHLTWHNTVSIPEDIGSGRKQWEAYLSHIPTGEQLNGLLDEAIQEVRADLAPSRKGFAIS